MSGWIHADKAELAYEAEALETPEWAVRAILRSELLTPKVVDPCCGLGRMSRIATEHGYEVEALDLYDWGYGRSGFDFLQRTTPLAGKTVFMNPPFSKAVEFVLQAKHLGARKIVCFQRFAWWESDRRRDFWDANPLTRGYVCGARASCWWFHIPPELRGVPKDKGGAGSGTPTAHAWFIWEQGQPTSQVFGRIYPEKGESTK